jgi:hypothetical protein
VADKEVVVPPLEDLTNYGKKLLDWSSDVSFLYSKSLTFKITPGSTPSGVALKTRFDQATKDFQTALQHLSDLLFTTGTEVIKIAKNYQTTEEINGGDIERLRGLVDAVKPYAPDVESIMPPNPVTVPYGGGPPGGGDQPKGPAA